MSQIPFPPPPPSSAVSAPRGVGGWPLGVASSIKVLSIIAAVTWGLFAFAILNRISVLQDLDNGTFGFDILQRAEDADTYAETAAGIGFGISVALAILLMIWLFRTTKMLRERGLTTRFKPGWAIGGFFIPIAQFVIIYQMISDCRKGLAQLGVDTAGNRYTPLPWWWGLQTAAVIAVQAASTDSEEIDTVLSQEYIRLGAAAGLIVAVVLAAITFGRFRDDYRKIDVF